jgi:CubicO group peptidase (beta-lactamase class C family)
LALVALVSLALAACQTSPAPEAPVPPTEAELDARIERIESAVSPAFIIEGEPESRPTLIDRMAELNVPGVSIALISGGEIEWARGWGVANVETGVPVTPATRFQAASISKPVAAMAALALVEEGLLDLDGPVNDKLTSWQIPDNEFTATAPVTLRGLLTHTAGTTVHGFGGYAAGEPVPDTAQVLAGEGNSGAVVVDVEPGTLWRYSGGGYTVMQMLVSDVTGQPFEQVLADRVLDPLGMEHSTYEQPLPEGLAGQAAQAYRDDGSMVEGGWHAYPEQAAAGLWTTPSDLARWAISIQRGRAAREHSVLSAEMIDQMLTAGPLGHGLGPAIMMDGTVFGHGGANEGYRCTVRAFIDGDEGVAIMTNSDSGGQLTTELMYTIAAEYGWEIEPEVLTVIELTAEELAEFAGTYSADAGWDATLTVAGRGLVATLSWSSEPAELLPDGADHFFARSDATPIQFAREGGEIVSVDYGGFEFRRQR